jgi:hypothetical protein
MVCKRVLDPLVKLDCNRSEHQRSDVTLQVTQHCADGLPDHTQRQLTWIVHHWSDVISFLSLCQPLEFLDTFLYRRQFFGTFSPLELYRTDGHADHD